MHRKYNSFSLICYFLKDNFIFFVASIAAGVLLTAFQMLLPQIFSVTVDSIIGSKPVKYLHIVEWFGGVEFLRSHLWLIAVITLAVGLLIALNKYLNAFFNDKGAELLTKRMKDTLFDKIQRLPLSWFSANHTGDIIQRCTSDTETIRTFVSEQLTKVINIVILITASLICLFSLNARLALITMLMIPIVLGYSWIFFSRFRESFLECDHNEGVLSAIAQENLTASRIVRAFGREIEERNKFDAQNAKYTDTWMALCRMLALFWLIGRLVTGLEVLLVIVCGSISCIHGSISTGDLIAFIAYNSQIIVPVRQLGRLISNMSKADASIERLRYIMNADEEKDFGKQLPFSSGDICFENVSFRYREEEILENISFTVKEGSTLGIIGKTGSGKTTLLLLLLRLIEPQQGRITIGGVDIQDIELGELRRNIGIVMQEPFLFSGTIGENIGISDAAAPPGEIRSAAQTACLDETIRAFTNGYDTIVGERGVTLSGGQKQRTALARALIRKTPLMLLDDALSAVDTETDAAIRHGLSQRLDRTTVLITSHRISTLMTSDLIILLENGKITEQGTHQQLLAQDGAYAKICRIQMMLPEEICHEG